MSITVEDGSGVTGADSYITVDEARTFALNRGVTLSSTDSEVEVLIYKSMDYLESFRGDFKGWKTDDDQALQWPRTGVYIDNNYIDNDEIPNDLKNALCQLVMDSNTSDIDPNGTMRETITEKVDVIEVEYNKGYGGTNSPILNKAKKFISPLLKYGLSHFNVIRI